MASAHLSFMLHSNTGSLRCPSRALCPLLIGLQTVLLKSDVMPTFGIRDPTKTYQPLPGAYAVIRDENNHVGVIETQFGFYLPVADWMRMKRTRTLFEEN